MGLGRGANWSLHPLFRIKWVHLPTCTPLATGLPTVHAFGSLSLTHTLLVQTHMHYVSAPCSQCTL